MSPADGNGAHFAPCAWRQVSKAAHLLCAAVGLILVIAPTARATDYTSTFTWDAARRLVFTIGADPGTGVRIATKNTYDGDGQLIEIDKGTTTTTTGSDFSALETTTYAYNAIGEKVQATVLNGTTTPALAITQFAYDADDRLTYTAQRMNPAIYGSLPASASTQGTAGNNGPDLITETLYDAAAQPVQTRQAVGTPLEQAYESLTYTLNGKVFQLIDARGNTVTSTSYDGFDRVDKVTFPDATFEQTGYDAADNPVSWTNRGGYQIQRVYDALNRKTSEKGVTGSSANLSSRWWDMADRNFSYDLAGRMTVADNASWVNHWSYDAAGRISAFTNGLGATNYTYDRAGNITGETYPSGASVGYAYDSLERMTTATLGSTTVASLTYDPLSRRSLTTFGDGSTTGYSYDLADRLTGLTQSFVNGVSANLTQTFGFDPASRQITKTSSNSAYQPTTTVASTSYAAADSANRYATVGSANLGYWGEGPLGQDGVVEHYYDEANSSTFHVLQSNGNAWEMTPRSALGEVFERQGNAPGGTNTLLYQASNGTRPERTIDLLFTAAYPSTSWNIVGWRSYVLGPNPDERLAYQDANGTIYYPHIDRQGSTIALATAGQNVLTRTYGPYGEITQPVSMTPGASAYPFLYTGQYYDTFNGDYDYKARDYDPRLGRFLQNDPIGTKDDANLYEYTHNDPLDHTDPSGEIGIDWRKLGEIAKGIVEAGHAIGGILSGHPTPATLEDTPGRPSAEAPRAPKPAAGASKPPSNSPPPISPGSKPPTVILPRPGASPPAPNGTKPDEPKASRINLPPIPKVDPMVAVVGIGLAVVTGIAITAASAD